MLEQAVILCGGRGTRLGSLTDNVPKPLVKIGNRVFLDYVIQNLTRFGIKNILLVAGYLGGQIYDRYDGIIINGAKCQVVIENEPLGTAGFLYAFTEHLDSDFILLNGDTIYDINLIQFIASSIAGSSLVHVATKFMSDTKRYGALKLENNLVTKFMEKNDLNATPAMINSGVYIIQKRIVEYLNKDDYNHSISLEHDILPALVKAKKVSSYTPTSDGYFVDIGLPETIREAEGLLLKNLSKPACFFDRDNTLNKDEGYTYKSFDLEWMPGAREAIKYLNDIGYYVFVVSNQSGIGRGYYSENDVHIFHHEMRRQLRSIGAYIDDFVFCPHNPNLNSTNSSCGCRKPAPGLILDLLEKWPVNKAKSLFIGDKDSDLEAGHNAGISSIKSDGSNLLKLVLSHGEKANVDY